MITSTQNTKIKQIRSLRQRKQRNSTGLFVVEGIRHVGQAAENNAPIEYLCYAPDLLASPYANDLIEKLNRNGIPCLETSSGVFTSISGKEHPSGMMAVVRQRPTPINDLDPTSFPWGVAIVSPQDPGNLGSILRTVDAVGASGLIVLESGVDIYHPTAVRSSMGSVFTKTVVQTTFEEFKVWSVQFSYHVYGSSAKGETPYHLVNFRSPSILLLGSEREGLSEKQAAVCQKILTLPMAGSTTSLNLSVAAGVFLYAMRLNWDT